MRNYSFLSCFLLLTLVLSGCLNALPDSSLPTQANSLTGTVRDSISGLTVWKGTATLGSRSVPISNGVFQFQDLTPGTYTLTIITQFYRPWQKQVAVAAAGAVVEAELTPIFSRDELGLLANLVHAEAKGECYQGQVAVAASVLNRLVHPDYPDTLTEVIHQVVVDGGREYYKYEPVLNGSIYIPADQTAINATADALAGWDPSLNATGFFAPAKVGANSWVWSRKTTVTIGNHRFFK